MVVLALGLGLGKIQEKHGFPKSEKANISPAEKKALHFAGKLLLELEGEALARALMAGVLLEVLCEQDH
ncbi:MAG: type II toxin-antitoxin system RelE/ParE family toxin [Rhodocyclales bacterium]|nr:type II toxin-antitoxin system RelE/ParE family toxin [Rhodocyclales bacterium]